MVTEQMLATIHKYGARNHNSTERTFIRKQCRGYRTCIAVCQIMQPLYWLPWLFNIRISESIISRGLCVIWLFQCIRWLMVGRDTKECLRAASLIWFPPDVLDLQLPAFSKSSSIVLFLAHTSEFPIKSKWPLRWEPSAKTIIYRLHYYVGMDLLFLELECYFLLGQWPQ